MFSTHCVLGLPVPPYLPVGVTADTGGEDPHLGRVLGDLPVLAVLFGVVVGDLGHLRGRQHQVRAEFLDDRVEILVVDLCTVQADHPVDHVDPLFGRLPGLSDHLHPALRVQPVADGTVLPDRPDSTKGVVAYDTACRRISAANAKKAAEQVFVHRM